MSINDKGEYKFIKNKSIDVTVDHRYINMEHEYKFRENYNVIIHDEASQKTEKDKKQIFKIPNKKNIFLGDLGYQLEPVIDYNALKVFHSKILKKDKAINEDFFDWCKESGFYEMTIKGFDNVVELTTDYRAKCDELKKVKKTLREFISNAKPRKADSQQRKKLFNQSIEFIKNKIQKITLDELKKIYKPTDMILTAKHSGVKKYNNMFSHYEKYLVTNTTKNYSNGEIIYKKIPQVKVMKYPDQEIDVTHAYTIHAIQGETLEPPNKLFIDINDIFSERHIYTAVSRARTLDQIYIIE
jgi:ATP-dependent exoDNAse (exonuclease V) alpha subunit